MSMSRVEGWEARLAEFIARGRTKPFQWGSWDCCSMPFEAVELITGVDPWAKLRGRYKTELGALRILKNFAGGGVVEMVEKIMADLGAPEVKIPFARRGDLCLLVGDPAGFGATLGVCLGRDVAVVTLDGLRFLPLTRVSRVWGMG